MMSKVSDFNSIQSEDIKHVEIIVKHIGPGKGSVKYASN